MIDLGTDRESSEELLNPKTGFAIVKNLKEKGQYVHRVLAGGLKVLETYYPTIRLDKDTNERKTTCGRRESSYSTGNSG